MLNIFDKCDLYFFALWITISIANEDIFDIVFITDPQEKQNKFNSQDMGIIVFNDLPKQSLITHSFGTRTQQYIVFVSI